jgi:hypothetical protein
MVALVCASSMLVLFRAAEAEAAPAPTAPRPEWNGSIGLSLIALRGNAESLMVSVSGTAERKTSRRARCSSSCG